MVRRVMVSGRVPHLKAESDLIYLSSNREEKAEALQPLETFLSLHGLKLNMPPDNQLIKQDSEEISCGGEDIAGAAGPDGIRRPSSYKFYEYRVLYCSATLKDRTHLDNCIIYPHGAPVYYDTGRFVAAGSVAAITPSRFLLPEAIRAAAAKIPYTHGDTYPPIVAKIQSELRYLVPPDAVFFRYQNFTGRDVDPQEWERYAENKKANYLTGEDMFDTVTTIFAEEFLV